MAEVSWTETPTLWTALVDGNPVCSLKVKDIGGCTGSWLDGRLWAPPAHMPKAPPQPTRFFAGLAEGKTAVEQQLNK